MSKAQEQFLLKCELARAILMKLWVKCLTTDEEREDTYKYIVEEFKKELDSKVEEN